jgi:hypothetical protein
MLKRDNRPLRSGLSLRSILVLCLVSGCAHNLSSDLLSVPPGPANKPVFHTVVLGVDPPRDRTQSFELEKFVEALRDAQLFRAVEYPHRLSPPNLILRSFSVYMTNPSRACFLGFQGQVLTIGTLGLFPQVCKSEHKISFVLVAPKEKRQRVPVSLNYDTRSIMGWAALFYLPFSDWTAKPGRERNVEVVKAAFYLQADEIGKLLGK